MNGTADRLKPHLARLAPVILGAALIPVPLLGDFHIESAVAASLAGCFWGALAACRTGKKRQSDFYRALHIAGRIYLAGLPLLAYAIFTGCFSVDGLGFWLLLPLPGVFFGYSIGRLLRIWGIPYRKSISIFVLSGIAIGMLLLEFFSFPQVYFFNHVWGGWPGPIYDEAVRLTGSFFFFRAITSLWILFLWFLPGMGGGSLSKWIVVLAAAGLALGYTQLAEMGIISPRERLQSALGGLHETEHFKLYYAKAYYSPDEIRLLGREHEFYLDRISSLLHLEKPDSTRKIESYLYAHAWQKKSLTGAKFTSYVPVWLDQDQLHIAKQQLESSLEHELVHVLAKKFGNKLFNASWSIGLVEGLAVAVAGGSSAESTIDQLVAARKPFPDAGAMEQALSPLGFYGGRSAVNYTTTGSFVRFLLQEYPVGYFKAAYAHGAPGPHYPVPFDSLVGSWHRHLARTETDTVDRKAADRLFGIPSLFEQKCPHVMSNENILLDRYRHALAARDTAKALHYLGRLRVFRPQDWGIGAEWVYRSLQEGTIRNVPGQAAAPDSAMELQLLLADALRMAGRYGESETRVRGVRTYLETHPDRGSGYRAAIETRSDSLQWKYYLEMTYRDRLFGPEIFRDLLYRTRIRTADKAMQLGRWGLLDEYAGILLEEAADADYVDTFLDLAHLLAHRGHVDLAKSLAGHLQQASLRSRDLQKVQKELEWIRFLESGPGS